MITRDQVLAVTAYVRSLSNQNLSAAETATLGAGRNRLTPTTAASCHGDMGLGSARLARRSDRPLLDLWRLTRNRSTPASMRDGRVYAALVGTSVTDGHQDPRSLCRHAGRDETMTNGTDSAQRRSLNWKLVALLIAGAGIALIIVANAHLVYVALDSQPECVPHAKQMDGAGTYRAARSAC